MAFGAQASARPIPGAVATVGVNERVTFIKKTYAHLGGAIAAFALLEWALITSELGFKLAKAMLSVSWLLVIGLFMVVGYVADRWARSDTSRAMQYVGLALYVVAQVVIFCPLLYIAAHYSHPDVIPTAGLLTLLVFGGLTATVFLTKKDFSFMRGALAIGGLAALGIIIGGSIFGFTLGLWFSVAMLILSAGYVLYYTSAVLAHYRPTQHVSAALALFAAIALMFWYMIQLVMSLTSD